ncbi:hypothetical protein CVT24_009006 [Panaeolus cyanescens]|uniref:Phosphatidylinositol-specific phospholipase C X domain-containing protein n=1 Tax=Panaeolus cyanescens TaxID=181874 RepID=A0A409YAM9_9AGAR|nr:hypothetical protein CVT24_009006 [Panaeolus cyanescens]
MLITIRNLSEEPISAHTVPNHSKFSASKANSPFGPPTEPEFILHPSINFSTTLAKGLNRELVLHRLGYRKGDHQQLSKVPSGDTAVEDKEAKVWHVHPEGFKIRLSMMGAASWQPVHVDDQCPWKVYCNRITRKHHQIIIVNRRNLGSFLSDLPDALPLSSVVLPGTHDTMAFHGWPISQCQSPQTPLMTQMLNGVRILDIRLAVIPPPKRLRSNIPTPPDPKEHKLIAYHGLWPQKTPFQDILSDVHGFLSSPIGMRETIVMSIKQEDFAITPAPFFSQLVRAEIVSGAGGWDDSKPVGEDEIDGIGVNRGMWFLENRIPRLQEVRGKVIMFSRFGGNGDGWPGGLEGLGIHPTTWPDSAKEGFEWELKGTTVRTHDWYSIPTFLSIPEKLERGVSNILLVPPNPPRPLLPITYFSASSFPLAFPPTIAKGFAWPKWGIGIEGINSRLGKWILDQFGDRVALGPPLHDTKEVENEMGRTSKQQSNPLNEPRIRGWTFLDYYSQPEGAEELVSLLVECNFKGRKSGEEGW